LTISLVRLNVDEGDASGALLSSGQATITLSSRVPVPENDIIAGQKPIVIKFTGGGMPPYTNLFPNDLIGPQTDDGPGTYYTISYQSMQPVPPTWSFQIISTDGPEQYLSHKSANPLPADYPNFLPVSTGAAPAAGQVPVFTGTGFNTQPADNNAKLEKLAAPPSSPADSRIWYNTITKNPEYYDGRDVVPVSSRKIRSKKWNVALANRHFAPQVVMCIGDSFTKGSNVSGVTAVQTWPYILNSLLSAKYPTMGLSTHGRGFLSPYAQGDAPDVSSYLSLTGTPDRVIGHGFDRATYDISAGGGCTLVYHLTGDIALIAVTKQSGGGSITYQVDAGSPTSYSSDGTGVDTILVNLGDPGTSHDLTIAYTASSGPFWLDGVIEQNGDLDKGLQVYNMGYSDSTTGDWTVMDWSQVAVYVPALIIMELGAADWQDGFAPDALAWSAVVSDMRTAGITAPIVFLAPPAPQGVSNQYDWSQYVYQMSLLGQSEIEDDFFDLSSIMPPALSGSEPYGLYDSGTGEITAVGNAYIADLLLNFLG
jgi:hypothetical protein